MFPVDRVNGSFPRGGFQTPVFDRPSDWDREIKRTGASEWRVCSINELYAICPRFELLWFVLRQEEEEGHMWIKQYWSRIRNYQIRRFDFSW